MNKLVYSSLVLTLVSTPGFATEWANLDQEINNLNASLDSHTATGPKLGGWLRSRFVDTDAEADLDKNGDNADKQGFQLDAVRLEISGDAGADYGYKVSFDLADGSAELKDAYVTFKLGDMATAKMGQFKTDFLRSSTVAQNRLVLLDRTALGKNELWDGRQMGLGIMGNFETIGWSLSAQNGDDGLSGDPVTGDNEHKFAAKVSADLMGGGIGKAEGAYGANDGTALSAGLSWLDDGSFDAGSAIGLEVGLTMSGFSLAGEFVDLDDDVGNNTPWDITGSYLFTQNWEAAVRYQDWDDGFDTTQMTVGVNYYISGHDIKWTAQYDTIDSDDADEEKDTLSLGLGVSF
jgi:hypothetical protein